MTSATMPISCRSSVSGSSVATCCCAASRICSLPAMASSRARTDFSRPTNSGKMMPGKWTIVADGQQGQRVGESGGRGRLRGCALAGGFLRAGRGRRGTGHKWVQETFDGVAPRSSGAGRVEIKMRREARRDRAISRTTRERTISPVMTTFWTSRWEGISYMMSCITCSIMVRRARAPVERLMASSAMACRASSVNFRSTPSNSKNLAYCLTRAFFGSVRIWTSAS